MFALGAKTLENELSEKYMNIAAGLTNTCHESYDRSATKLGPEAFHFIEGNEARSLKNGEKYYILRPEVSRLRFHLKTKLIKHHNYVIMSLKKRGREKERVYHTEKLFYYLTDYFTIKLFLTAKKYYVYRLCM